MNNEFKRMQKLAGLITEGYGAEEYEKGKEAGEKTEKKKMKKSELKKKIKEMILAEIDGEDYGDIGPGGDIEAGEYGYEEMEKLKQLTAGEDYDSMDDSDLVKAAYDQGMEEVVVMNDEGDLINREEVLDALKGSLEEAKKKKEEEPAEEEIDMTADMEAPEGEADMGMDIGAMDTTAPAISGDAQSVQKELMDALEAAKAMGDEKLVRQIGNALTYFTRQQVSGEEAPTMNEGIEDTDVSDEAYSRMESLVNQTDYDNFIDSATNIMRDLTKAKFDVKDVFYYLYTRLTAEV